MVRAAVLPCAIVDRMITLNAAFVDLGVQRFAGPTYINQGVSGATPT